MTDELNPTGDGSVEGAVHTSEQFFHALVRSTHDAITILDANGLIKYKSPAADRILGYEPDELIDTSIVEIIHPDDRAKASAALGEVAQTSGSSRSVKEVRLRCKDGSWRSFEAVLSNQLDDPNVRGIIGSHWEITERKRMEESSGRAAELDAFRVKLSDALRPLADPVEIQGEATRIVGEHLRTDRTYYAEIDNVRELVIVDRDYVCGGAPSLVGRYDYGFVEPPFNVMRWGRPFIANDVHADPRFSEPVRATYDALSIRSFICAPLVKGGELVACLCVANVNERTWTAEEIGLLQDVAERTWNAVERARAEEALHESEERLQKAISIETVGVLFFNLDGQVTGANEAFARMSGYSREELLNMVHWEVMTPPEFMDVTEHAAEELATRGETAPYEKQLIRKDGSRWWVLSAYTRISGSGSGSECVKFAIDITERKRAEALQVGQRRVLELIAQDATLEQVLEALAKLVEAQSDGMLCSILLLDDDDLHLRYGAGRSLPDTYNQAIDGIAIGPKGGSCGTAAYRREPVFVTDIATDPLWYDYRDLALSHGLRACHSLPMYGGKGELLGTLATYYRESRFPSKQDLELMEMATHIGSIAIERRRAEEEREEARRVAEEAVRARDEFLSIASHELRNPIAALKATSQLLRRAFEQDRLDQNRTDRYTHTLLETSDRLALLTDDLLDVSRIRSGRFPIHKQLTDLASLVREATEAQKVSSGRHRLRVKVEGEHPISADPERIRQVVVNLLDNAIKYSADGSEVRIVLSRDEGGTLLRVRDQGIGLAKAELESIFQPFGRASNAAKSNIPGMGLGLYVCRQIAEAHEGKLWAESDGEDKGTTMLMWLPNSGKAEGGSEA